MKKISIVIPNYNGENLLKKNLPKVFEAVEYYVNKQNAQAEIVVVDDCSTDESVEEIKNEKLKMKNYNVKLKIVQNDRNLGFSSTVNRGVKEAAGEIVVLLNTDVVPEKNFLQPLLSHFRDEDIFAVGCMDKSVENGKIVLRGRGIGKWERGFLVHSRGEVNKTDTLWVSGGSGAFRKSIWEKLGGFDELYNPFYWEDIDLSYRGLKSGYKILFEPKSTVVHEHEKGSIKKEYSESEVKTIVYRNQFIFVWKNATDIDLWLLHFNFWVYYHFLKALIQRDWSFFLGFFKAYIRLPQIVQARFGRKNYFTKSDHKVVKEFKQ